MANTVNRIYHIHQYHLDTNFMPTPLRTRHENTHGQIQNSEFEMNTTEANVTTEEKVEAEDDFQSINLEISDSENHVCRQTSIANDNFDEESINTVYPIKRFDGSIYPQADIRTQNGFSGVPRKRLRQWSENDLYLPEMRNYYKNRTFSDLQRPHEQSMSSNMQRINRELQSHSQQLQKISNDVQHLYKVCFALMKWFCINVINFKKYTNELCHPPNILSG